jgi:hypothetical protein
LINKTSRGEGDIPQFVTLPLGTEAKDKHREETGHYSHAFQNGGLRIASFFLTNKALLGKALNIFCLAQNPSPC